MAMQPYPTNYALDSSIVYFPSTNFTYCGAADATCGACKSSWTQIYKDTGMYPLNTFCQGESGCICVSQCELPSFTAKVITSQCSIFGNTAGPAKRIYSAVSAVGVVVIGVTIFRAWRREKRDQGAMFALRLLVSSMVSMMLTAAGCINMCYFVQHKPKRDASNNRSAAVSELPNEVSMVRSTSASADGNRCRRSCLRPSESSWMAAGERSMRLVLQRQLLIVAAMSLGTLMEVELKQTGMMASTAR